MTRSFGGDEDHPTMVSFSHIYSLLSLYTPIKACITGNVTAEPTLVLATVQETMKLGKKDKLASHERLQETLRVKLAEICSPAQVGTKVAPDHGCTLPSAQDCVVYYLCGYLVRSFLKHERCPARIENFQSSSAQCPEALLTLQREFKEGSLKLPSWELFSMFRNVEREVSPMLEENSLCVDSFWNLLETIKDCDVPSVSCPAHKDILSAELVQAYIVLCLHFAAKDASRKLGVSQKVVAVRKKAKLL
ncbi:unnamed protein product [Ixodes pacificus]